MHLVTILLETSPMHMELTPATPVPANTARSIFEPPPIRVTMLALAILQDLLSLVKADDVSLHEALGYDGDVEVYADLYALAVEFERFMHEDSPVKWDADSGSGFTVYDAATALARRIYTDPLFLMFADVATFYKLLPSQR